MKDHAFRCHVVRGREQGWWKPGRQPWRRDKAGSSSHSAEGVPSSAAFSGGTKPILPDTSHGAGIAMPATVFVPAKNTDAITESGKSLAKAAGLKLLRIEGDRAVLEVEKGSCRFAVGVSRLRWRNQNFCPCVGWLNSENAGNENGTGNKSAYANNPPIRCTDRLHRH